MEKLEIPELKATAAALESWIDVFSDDPEADERVKHVTRALLKIERVLADATNPALSREACVVMVVSDLNSPKPVHE